MLPFQIKVQSSVLVRRRKMKIRMYSILSSVIILNTPCLFQEISKPWMLPNGDLYRDKNTIETAKMAAIFARQLCASAKVSKIESISSGPAPYFVSAQNFTFGNTKSSAEIFDFVDSRFLTPPLENRQNWPQAERMRMMKMTADDSLEIFSSGGRRFSLSGQQKQSSSAPSQLPDGIHHDNLDTLDDDDDDDGAMEDSKETLEDKTGIFPYLASKHYCIL